MAAAPKLRVQLLDEGALAFKPRGPQFVDLVTRSLGNAGLPSDGTDEVIDKMISALPGHNAFARQADSTLSPAYSSVAALSVYTGHALGDAAAQALVGGDNAESAAGQLLPSQTGAPTPPSPQTMGPAPPVGSTQPPKVKPPPGTITGPRAAPPFGAGGGG